MTWVGKSGVVNNMFTKTNSEQCVSNFQISNKQNSNTKLKTPFSNVISARYWANVDKWEKAPIQNPTITNALAITRGEWIDHNLNLLLEQCHRLGYVAEDDQGLRDELFDFMRSVSH